ncbi:MAG: DUF418 domain-containing protein [Kofleriaceae bacterium]
MVGPVAPRERLVTLDALRGFAMLGVLLGNLAHLYSGMWADWQPPRGYADIFSHYFISVVVQSKAQTLLTFLFGFGFANQIVRASGASYWRRVLALFGFGLAHVTLLWWGDVLWTYAVAAPFLLLFVRVSNRTRVIVGGIFIFVGTAMFREEHMARFLMGLVYDPDRHDYATPLSMAIQFGTHTQTMIEQIKYTPIFSIAFFPAYVMWILGNFLLGYAAGTAKLFERDGADHLPVFRRIFWIGFALGIGATAFEVLNMTGVIATWRYEEPLALVFSGITALNYCGLALLFAASVVLLAQRPFWRRVFQIVAPVGRMPLTTYLSQSLICTTVIYHWGFDRVAHWNGFDYLWFGFVVYAFQIAFSNWWFTKFRFGPLEWLWRRATYSKAVVASPDRASPASAP